MNKTLSQKIQIIPISREHIESFHRCLDSVSRERLYLAFLEAPPLESVKEYVESNIANDIPQFVALAEGEVIGWCDISPLKLEGFRHCGRLGMGVHKDYRNSGIGRMLIVNTIQKAVNKGMERIELEVFASNKPAITLYEKMGFKVEGIKRKARKIDQNYEDIIEMALLI
ncbi:MAG: N-acetyltransferase family protein [Bacillota bacterium]